MNDVEEDVSHILNIYSELSFQPPPSQWTVAASFYLVSLRSGFPTNRRRQVISIATGTKCLPTSRYPLQGEALFDSHAEVLARRGAIRWFLRKILRESSGAVPEADEWLHRGAQGKYRLKQGVRLCLYISTVPCGDASTRLLASLQNEEMAALKDSAESPLLSPDEVSRGRDNYARLSVLRTKPGRADSPMTTCMSCSDKIASWSVLGIQGAIASRFFEALYISSVVIGEVPTDMQEAVMEDCERALWKRLMRDREQQAECIPHIPSIIFTTQIFVHSRTTIETKMLSSGSCNEALCWIADEKTCEILISGMKRGVPTKHRFREKSWPRLCKLAMFQLHNQLLEATVHKSLIPSFTYHEAKQSMTGYQTIKRNLMGPQGAFSGWIRNGDMWQSFGLSKN